MALIAHFRFSSHANAYILCLLLADLFCSQILFAHKDNREEGEELEWKKNSVEESEAAAASEEWSSERASELGSDEMATGT